MGNRVAQPYSPSYMSDTQWRENFLTGTAMLAKLSRLDIRQCLQHMAGRITVHAPLTGPPTHEVLAQSHQPYPSQSVRLSYQNTPVLSFSQLVLLEREVTQLMPCVCVVGLMLCSYPVLPHRLC